MPEHIGVSGEKYQSFTQFDLTYWKYSSCRAADNSNAIAAKPNPEPENVTVFFNSFF